MGYFIQWVILFAFFFQNKNHQIFQSSSCFSIIVKNGLFYSKSEKYGEHKQSGIRPNYGDFHRKPYFATNDAGLFVGLPVPGDLQFFPGSICSFQGIATNSSGGKAQKRVDYVTPCSRGSR